MRVSGWLRREHVQRRCQLRIEHLDGLRATRHRTSPFRFRPHLFDERLERLLRRSTGVRAGVKANRSHRRASGSSRGHRERHEAHDHPEHAAILDACLVSVFRFFRAQPRTAAKHEEDGADDEDDGENGVDHFGSPPKFMLLKSSTNLMTPGPTAMTKNAGSRQTTSGKISLTESFAAFSSARWRRLIRDSSACVRSAWATLVPKRSVWTSIATSARTSSTIVRFAKFFSASTRGLPARVSVLMN